MNSDRHPELYYGISGIGAVLHVPNDRPAEGVLHSYRSTVLYAMMVAPADAFTVKGGSHADTLRKPR